MKRMLAIVCVGLFVVLWSGCGDLNPLDDDSVTITIDAIGSIAAGDYKAVTGDVDANTEITSLTATILNSDQTTYAGSAITVSKQTVTGEDKIDLAADANLEIRTTAAAVSGSYYLRLEATAGTAESSKNAAFTITGGMATQLDTFQVTLGAQGSSFGSALDADLMEAYNSTQASSNSAAMDAVYGIYSSASTLMSPAFAASAGFGASSWPTQNATQFVVLASAPDPTSTTQADIDAAYAAGTKVDHVTLSLGQFIIIHTSDGANRLVGVLNIVSGTSGNVLIVGFIEVSS